MNIEQTLQNDIQDAPRWLNLEKDESTYKSESCQKDWINKLGLESMKNPNVQICELMESRLNQIILKINQEHDIFEADKLHSELRILDYLFYQVCKDKQKNLATNP